MYNGMVECSTKAETEGHFALERKVAHWVSLTSAWLLFPKETPESEQLV